MKRSRQRRPRGTGSIFQRADGRWCGILSLGDHPDGRRNRRIVYARKGETVTQLATRLESLRTKIGVGEEPQAKATATLSVFLDEWLEKGVVRASEDVLDHYRSTIRVRLRPHLGHLRLEKITPKTIDSYLSDRIKDGTGARALYQDYQVLHAAFACAVRWKTLASNPVTLATKPAYEAPERPTLTPKQVRSLMLALVDEPLRALYLLAMATGLRPSELIGLQWGDVDFKAGVLAVRRSINQKNQLRPTKTKGSVRTMPLPSIAIEALKTHRGRKAKSIWVFAREDGQPLERRSVARNYEALRDRCGLPAEFWFKDLRHTYGTMLKTAGAHPKVAQSLLGHASINTTMKIYTHVVSSDQRAAAAGVDRILRQAQGKKRGSG